MSSKSRINKGLVNEFLSATKKASPQKDNMRIRQIEGDLNIHELSIDLLINAPSDWNFYKPLNDNKMEQLIMSIMENGLLNPIIVWETEEGLRYMVLSGHNRLEAHRKIYEQTGDSKYLKIPAFIKAKDEITKEQAQEIIIDTNWVQRELTAMEKAKSILKKYAIVDRDISSRKKRKRDIICEDYGLKGRQVENYYKLNSLTEEFKGMLDESRITIKSGVKLALFDPEIQMWMFQNFRGMLDYKRISKLKSGMNKDDIEKIFEVEKEEEMVTMKVPKSLQNQIKEIIKNYHENSK
ncbi:chromosome partitioning protein, ParB family [Peptoclostridium litorale DSM 5388]|uniref:ParB-like protein n=1 Tax=Peptoclostridium litorale DSM 5388 TaxID=1121324 RepID=A0A069RGP5_PEPLI|nr:ParB/RepB/Spo0J family partition protein [Peptoclostridium litorale]KDR95968.1 ParB-like protein [Peptoclostridium litorale DSM 5388]SIO09001.1 chromosome partitioning protein, ParB family [Peptoclostridium litorale DSM 5388]